MSDDSAASDEQPNDKRPAEPADPRERCRESLRQARAALVDAIKEGDVVLARRRKCAVQLLSRRWSERFAKGSNYSEMPDVERPTFSG
jgi:hypothetical protein